MVSKKEQETHAPAASVGGAEAERVNNFRSPRINIAKSPSQSHVDPLWQRKRRNNYTF